MSRKRRYVDHRQLHAEHARQRAEAAARAARQRQPVDGLYPVRIPTLLEDLEQLDHRSVRLISREPEREPRRGITAGDRRLLSQRDATPGSPPAFKLHIAEQEGA